MTEGECENFVSIFRKRFNPLSLYSLMIGILVALLNSYRYGVGDHVEQLPLILRAIDPNYLPLDPFINSQSGFGPRYYYVFFFSQLSNLLPLPTIFFLVYLFVFSFISYISALTAKTLFPDTPLAGYVASTLMMLNHSFLFGNKASPIEYPDLIPSLFAMPFTFASLLAALSIQWNKWFFSVLVSILIHPVIGAEGMVLSFLGLVTVTQIWTIKGFKKYYIPALTYLFILLLSFIFLWWLPGKSNVYSGFLSPEEFVSLMGRFRHPHHFILSTWGTSSFISTLFFLMIGTYAWTQWKPTSFNGMNLKKATAIISGSILLSWFLGGFFIEIYPTKLGLTLQTYRLGYILSFLGLIIVSGVSGTDVISVGLLSQLWLMPLSWIPHRMMRGRNLAALSYGLGTVLAGYLLFFTDKKTILCAILLIASYWFSTHCKSVKKALLPALSILLFSTFFMLHTFFHPVWIKRSLAGLKPQITLEDNYKRQLPISNYIAHNVPSNALFLTPPNWGGFRLFARRAILVDWKSFPFDEKSMIDWRSRILDVLGPPSGSTYSNKEMEQKYRSLTFHDLQRLQKEYGITHAILPTGILKCLTPLFEFRDLKVVDLAKSSC